MGWPCHIWTALISLADDTIRTMSQSQQHGQPPHSSSKSFATTLAALFLLAIHVGLAYQSLRIKSVTYDELTHLPAGMAIAASQEIQLNRQHPPLVKWLAGLAANTTDPHIPFDDPSYSPEKEWEFGAKTLFAPENDHWQMLRRGRLPTVGFSVLAGWVIFLWARRRSGEIGALFAVGLWAFSPSALAHARWVTMDAAVTALGMLSLYLWWRVCESTERAHALRWALVAGLALGLTLGAKFSGLVLIPAMVLADFLVTAVRFRMDMSAWKHWIRARAMLWSALGAVAAVTLWTLYLFPADPLFYLKDLSRLYADLEPDYRFYLAGQFQEGRFPHYFLATFLLKSTLPELLIAAAVAAILLWRRSHHDLFLVIPAFAWFAATTIMASNQGHRYILLLYPLLFVAAADFASSAIQSRRPALGRLVLGALVLTQALEVANHHPDYLPYFNRLAGGPLAGPYWLDDSNVDWNQDIGRAAAWLDAKGIDSVRTIFFGRTHPEHYGLKREPFRRSDWKDGPRPGAYLISAHVLSRGLELKEFEGYNSDWLIRYQPTDVLGGSLYLYVFP